MKKKVTILAIESSCDDTSAAVICDNKILSNIICTQKVHQQYGGVVPELASRAHLQNIVPTVHSAILEAKIERQDLDAIAYTRGPGLMGSLLVGASFAKSMSLSLNIPLIEVNHMNAHILAHFIDDNLDIPEFPFLCLTISGGHTQIVEVLDYFKMNILGQTLDDAVGESFDKIGKMLGLNYPAGPLIDELSKKGNPKKFRFTKPKVDALNFSFSGLKTNVLYFLQKETAKNPDFIKDNINDLCASVQFTIINILMDKLKLASKQTGINNIAIAGGVSANSGIRNALKKQVNWKVFLPKVDYTTDNAAMIAMVGKLKYDMGVFSELSQKTTARYL